LYRNVESDRWMLIRKDLSDESFNRTFRFFLLRSGRKTFPNIIMLSRVAAKVMGEQEEQPIHGSPKGKESKTETMKAATWQGKRKVEIKTMPKPVISHPKDGIVRVTCCSICDGSDGHLYNGEIPGMYDDYILGHEAMGIVEAVGDDVQNIKVGDRIVIPFDISCGECEQCKKGQFSGCYNTNHNELAKKLYGNHSCSAILGYSETAGGLMGTQAEYVRVPFVDVNSCKVPVEVPDVKALYLSDIVCTSLHATEMADVKEGCTVAIWGLGPVGLCTARWCQIKKAKRIVAIDLVPERLTLAREELGIEVLDRSGLDSDELCDKLQELEPYGFDCCIDAVGLRFAISKKHKVAKAETDSPEIISEALHVLKPYGTCEIIGDYVGLANLFPIGKIMFKNATVRSGQCPCQRYMAYCLEKIRDGTFDPTFVVTHRIDLDQVPEAYKMIDEKSDGIVKVFVDMHEQKQ